MYDETRQRVGSELTNTRNALFEANREFRPIKRQYVHNYRSSAINEAEMLQRWSDKIDLAQ